MQIKMLEIEKMLHSLNLIAVIQQLIIFTKL